MAFEWLKKTKGAPAGRGTGVSGSGVRSTTVSQREAAKLNGPEVVKRRHNDWTENQMRWRFLLDSLEGGNRYRNAVYGPDRRGQPCRNLFRHRREYPDPQQYPDILQGFATGLSIGETVSQPGGLGSWPGMLGADPGATAMDDDYELRRARTPIPEFTSEAVGIHVGKVYDQEVAREGDDDLTAWWLDVDGRGTPIDDYMRETIAPLLLVLGCLDVVLDRPEAPPDEPIVTRADELRLGLDKCVASYILPENMLWWRTDAAGRYTECLVREYADPSDRNDTDENGNPIDPNADAEPDADAEGGASQNWRESYVRYRLWNGAESILFNYTGDDVLKRVAHPYGRVPIVRLMELKKHRTPNVGKSRYEAIAEYQREFYNRDSELILSDTLQAHPYLSGAEDFCKADNTQSIGPCYVLPMKKNPETGSYQGWEFVSPPKDPAASLRVNKQDLIDLKDRHACLEKPAGAVNGTVGQSGISKRLDQHTGHKHLSDISRSLARNERVLAEYALLVLRARPITTIERDGIKVVDPNRFELQSAADLSEGIAAYQALIKEAGSSPMVEAMGLKTIVRQLYLGLTDVEYKTLDAEIDAVIAARATIHERKTTLDVAGIADATAALEGNGSAEQAAQADPSGQSGSTMVSTPNFVD